MNGRALMVQGCSSSAGKSYLTAALCRLYARRGVTVAPFKAQNMSNNAGVTPNGLEMGRAQLTQALAARVIPDVRMNPVLIKPEGDTRSQVVVLGKRDDEVAKLPWTARKEMLWPVVQESLQSLLTEFDLVIIEGAGSPAEVNLKAGDIVNMRVAREARAKVLLAADIDRGGAFAHLLGTWSCLDVAERETLLGFILNKFRGDPALLGDGTAWLEKRTGVPTLGVVPYLPLVLPEEDAHTLEVGAAAKRQGKLEVAIIRFPSVSNFDEFDPLTREPEVVLRWVEAPEGLMGAQLIILPGSKHVAADGAWLAHTGLAEAIQTHAKADVQILGVCGGLQLLGKQVSDPHGVEGGADHEGLGLLELDTTLETEKITRVTQTELLATGTQVSGYEIHHGRSHAWGETRPFLSDGLGFNRGNVTGVYLHGLFEDTAFRMAFLGALGVRSSSADWAEQLDCTLDTLADHTEAHLDMAAIDAAIFKTPTAPRSPRSHLILVTGGVRSGKSRYAEALVTHYLNHGKSALYLATLTKSDPEMERRIEAHQARRPERWRTLEIPFSPSTALQESSEPVVLLDCLSGLVSNLLLKHEADGEAAVTNAVIHMVDEFTRTVRAKQKTVIIVTNEVGSGVVPAYPLGRWYRDALGLANARIAALADAVAFCVVGVPQTLKGELPEVSLDAE